MSPTAHSPIIGWMIDGLPIYGPYGYGTALNSGSAVRRMVGGFVKRDGTTTGVDNITSTGRTLPAWMLRNNGNTNVNGPTVSTTYPFGRYIQDWAYLGDLQKSAGVNYQQGVDFDLNEYNVRYCVTPEFPSGTWAYFVNINSTGTPQFPYMCNRWFYGTPTGGQITSVAETVTSQFQGGPNRPLTIPNTPVVSGTSVTMTWNAVEGGTYSVDASTNDTTWTNKATGLTVSNANTKSNTHTALGTSGTEYGRVQRTALATYDTTGVVTPTVSQTATTTYSLGFPPTAPTLTSISTLSGATEDTAFTISYANLAAAANEADVNGDAISFRIESVLSGTLVKNGSAVTPGSTLISAGDSVVWTPAANENGTLAAFAVKAWDGALASSSSITVNVAVTPVADPGLWDGGGGSGDWATATNWADNMVPAAGETVNFTGATPVSITLGAERVIGGLNLSGNSAYDFTGGSFTLAAGGGIVTSNPSSGSLAHVIATALNLQGAGSISTAANASLLVSGNLTTSGELVKSGAGTLTLAGTVAAGQVRVKESGTLLVTSTLTTDELSAGYSGTAGTIQASGNSATLTLGKLYVGTDTTGSVSLANGAKLVVGDIQLGVNSGSTGSLSISGAGTTLTSTGVIFGNAGSTVSIGSGAAVVTGWFNDASVTMDNASLLISELGTNTANFLVTSGGATMGAGSDSASLTGTISGSGTLVVSGPGELQITGNHTRTGDTIIQQGTLRMTTASFSDSYNVSISSSSKLDLYYTGTDTIHELNLGGTLLRTGTWGGVNSSATFKNSHITGTGILNVTGGPYDNVPVMNSVTEIQQLTVGTTRGEYYATVMDSCVATDPDGDAIMFRVESVSNGSLTKNGVTVTPGVTTISSGEKLVWNSTGLAPGTYTGFTLKAWDGTAVSTNVYTVNFIVKQTFANWAASIGLTGTDAAVGADPDHDGVANGLEFVFGSSPLAASASPITSSVANGYLTLVFPITYESDWNMKIAVETSNDLTTWKTYWSLYGTQDGIIFTYNGNGSAGQTITVKIPVGTKATQYARLRAELK